LKALFPVLLASWNGDEKVAVAAAIGAIVGHDFPVYLGFRGGKGVATTLGAMFALCWQCAIFFLAVWFSIVSATKYVSLASLVGLYSAALFSLLVKPTLFIPLLIFSTIALARHRSNVERLLKGKERKTDIWGYVKRS